MSSYVDEFEAISPNLFIISLNEALNEFLYIFFTQTELWRVLMRSIKLLQAVSLEQPRHT